jgi:hypothetical protein
MKKKKQQQVDLRPRRRPRRRLTFSVVAGLLMTCGILSYISSQSPEYRARTTSTASAKNTQTAVAVLNEQTASVQASKLSTNTPPPTATLTDTPPAKFTSTTLPLTFTPTDTATLTITDEVPIYRDLTVYVLNEARLRACPSTDCEAITTVFGGTALTSDYLIAGEDAFGQGERNWYRVFHNGREAFVYAALVALNPPVTSVPVVPALPGQTWDCSRDIYNCSDFANRRELESYWNACPGDPSRLDGNPKNGVPCDSSWR